MYCFFKHSNSLINRFSSRFLASVLFLSLLSPLALFSSNASAGQDIFSLAAQCTQTTANTNYDNSFMSSASINGFVGDHANGWFSSSRGWVPDNSDTAPWYGFIFDTPKRISAVKTKGQSNSDNWVTSYRIEITKTAFTGSFVANDAANVVANTTWAESAEWVDLGTFTGNVDSQSVVRNAIAKRDSDWTAIRIFPVTFNGRVALQFAIETCSSNLKLWLKGEENVYKDDGVTLAGPNNAVKSWLDSSGNNFHAKENSLQGGSASDKQPIYKHNIGNSHSSVFYDGVVANKYSMGLHLGNNYLYSSNNGYSIFAVATSRRNDDKASHLFDFGSLWSKGTGLFFNRQRFDAYINESSGGKRHSYYEGNVVGTSQPILASTDIVFNDSINLSVNANEVMSGAITTPALTADIINEHHVYGSTSTSRGPVSIGRQSKNVNFTSENRTFDGHILEILFIDEAISALQKQKINSYLGIKHGLTLDTSIGAYINSDGEVLWNDTAYWNHIIGVGKDGGSGLDQRISKSQADGRSLVLSTDDNTSWVNLRHSDTIVNNSFLLIGSDNEARNSSKTTDLDTTKYARRIKREWKVVNTNFNTGIYLTFSASPDRNGQVRRLLWDADGDFTSGSIELAYSFNRSFYVDNLPSGYLAVAFEIYGPTGEDKALTLSENESITLQESDFGFADINDSGRLRYVKITSLNIQGSLTLNSEDVLVNDNIDVDDIPHLVFTPLANQSGDNYSSFDFKLSNDTDNQENDLSEVANTITFNVININNQPQISGVPLTSVNEDSAYSFIPTVIDADVNDTTTFSIINKPTWASFDTATGLLSGTPTNGDVGNTSNIVISVADGDNASDSLAAFSITVTNTNDAPVISGAPTTSVDEGQSYSFTPNVVDVDVNDINNLTFSITNKPSWASFDTTNGALTGTPSNANVGTTSNITISVSDGNGGSDTLTAFDITVNNVNDAPVLSGAPSTTVNELTAYDFTPTLTDADVGDSHNFTIANKPSWASFSVSDGRLSGTPSASDIGTYSNIVISVSDAVGATDDLTAFSIEVTNVNDAPTIGGTPSATVNQDATYVFVPSANDIDSGDTKTFSITNKPSWASFNTANGRLEGTPDNDDVATYSNITIQVEDSGGLTATTVPFSIEVINVNDAPTIIGSPDLSIAEGQAYNFAPTINDIDNGDNYSVTINNKPSWATLNPATGVLSGTPTNSDVGTFANIEIIVTDSANAQTLLPAFGITVTNVNDAPVISGTPNTTVAEDSSYSFTPTVTDIDVGDSHTFSIANAPTWATFSTSTGQLSGTPTNSDVGTTTSIVISVKDAANATSALTAFNLQVTNTNDAPTIGGSPTTSVNQGESYSFTPTYNDVDTGDGKTFSITNKPSWANFDNTTGALTGTPGNSHVGETTNIVISVEDTAGESASLAPFTLTVNNTNDAPVISGSPTTTIAQGAAYSFSPTVTDADTNDSKAFSITGMPSWASFDNASGALTGTPDNSDVGTYSNIVITVTDGANAQDSLAVFSIEVTNVNDAPTITGTPAISVNEDSSYSFTPTASDIDVGDSKTFSITNKPTWANFDTVTGALTGTPDNSHVASTTGIVITVTDGGGLTASTPSFNIEVINVNDAPVISGSPTTTIAQDEVYSFTPSVTDVDDVSHTFSIVNKPNWLTFSTSDGSLTGTSSNDDVGTSASIVISVKDAANASATLTGFTITVTNVNDAPTISGTPATSVLENAIYNFTPTANDIDVGDTLTFDISGKPSWASFEPTTGKLTGTPVNADVGTDSGIVITVTDGNSTPVALASFDIEVVNVNQAPALADSSFSVDENSPNNTTVGTMLNVVDPDASSTFTFSIVNGNSDNAFKIDDSGQLAVNNVAALNHEAKASYALTIEVSDGALTDTAAITVAINDVVEAATFDIEDIVSTDVAEDSVYTSPLARINGLPIGNIIYSISGNDAALFSVDSTTGQLTLTAKDFENPTDQDTSNTYEVTLTATDDDNNTDDIAVTITVTNTNVAPVINGAALVDQNPAEDFASYTLDFTVSDADQDNLTLSVINSDPSIVTATITPTTSQTFAQYDGTTYQLTLSSVSNQFGGSAIKVVVTDQHGLTNVVPFNITIPSTLDFPTINNENVSLNEDFSDYELTLTGLDFNGQPSLTISMAYSDASVVAPFNDVVVNAPQTTQVITLQAAPDANGTTTGTITVEANGTISKDISITVNAVNDAPTVSGTPALATELVAYSWTPTFDDIDNANSTLTFSATNLPSWASINTTTGEVSGTPTVHDDGVTNNVVISVSDGALSASMTVTISVNNVNQAPVFSNTNVSVAENSANDTLVITHVATDIDSGSLSYAIVSGNTDNAFKVNDSGEIRVNASAALNYEQHTSFDVEISATDGDGLIDNAIVTIDLTDVNEAPTISGTPATAAQEDVAYSFTPTANDVDAGDDLIFSISNEPAWTTFDSATGQLSGLPDNNDLGTTSNIVITVTDNDGLNASLASFDITVINTNDAPVISGTPTTSVNEDSSYSFTPTVSDADANDTTTFSIVNQPAWANFDTATGELSGTPNNSHVGTTTSIVISVADALNATDSLNAFDLTVNNVNDAPSIAGTPASTVAQGASYSFTPSLTDIDVGDSHTFSIVNLPSWANFDATTGQLSGTPANGDVNTFANIQISVADGANASASLAAFSIEVTNVNDAPVISGTPAATVAQGASYSFTPVVVDIDVGDSKVFTITNMPSWAIFDSTTGQLSGTPTNDNVTSYPNIVISVTDGSNASDSLSPFSIEVTNVNDAPTISGSPTTTVAQGASYSFTPTATDIDSGDSKTFSVVNKPDWASFDTTTGELSGTPTNGDVGTVTGIIITVVDGGGLSDSLAAFNLTVTNVNDAPTISGSPVTTATQGTAYSFTPSANDIDVGDSLSFSAANLPSWLTINTSTGELTGTPANGDVGNSSSIVITVADAANETASLSGFVINVVNVNDAPALAGTPNTSVSQDAAYSFIPTLDDVDVGDSHTFTIVNKPAWASFDTATGALTGTPTNSHVGLTSSIVISVSDAANASDSLTAFDIEVLNVNDAPTIIGTPATTVAEDSLYSFTPTADDIDAGDSLTYSISNAPSWASFDVMTGQLSGTPSNSDVGVTNNIVITVTDAANAQASMAAFSITVTNVNDAPVISGTPATSVDEGSTYSFTPLVSDDDAGDSATFSISNKPSWANFDSATGQLAGTPGNSDVASYPNIVISVKDSANATDSLAAFTLVVNNVNDAPQISGSPASTVAQDAAYSFTPVVTDIDVGDSKFFSITNKPSWANFSTATGALTGTPSNDDLGTTTGVVISVTDGGGEIASLPAFNINVTNVNDAPTISGTPATSVLEGAVYSFTPTANDVDAGDSLTFSIVNKPDWASFNTATGQLTGTPTNSDVDITNAIVISVADSSNAVTSLPAFNLEVVNVNQAPAIANANFSVAENSANDTLVGTPLVVVDPDVGSSFNFSITNGNLNNAFKVDANGQLAVNDMSALDFETKPNFALTVTVSDGSLTDTAIVNVAISDVVEVVNFTIESVFSSDVNENSDFESPAATLSQAPIGNVVYSISGNDAALFNVDSDTGRLTLSAKDFELPQDSDTNNSYEVILTATDDDGNSHTKTIVISVQNVNVAPVLSSSELVDMQQIEDFGHLDLAFMVDDADKDDVTLSVVNSDPTLLDVTVDPNTTQEYGDYNGATFNVALDSISNQFGSASIQLIAKDMYDVTDVISFNVAIPAVLDFPSINNDSISLNEDFGEYDITLTGLDFNGEASLTISMSYSDPSVVDAFTPVVVTAPNTQQVIKLKASANANGVTTGTITVTAGASSVSKDIAIAVSAVNDAPMISGTPSAVNEGQAFNWTPTFDDIDNDNNTLVFSASNLPAWASIDVNSGAVTGTPSIHDSGVYNDVVITVSDGALTASTTVTITVNDVNQAPTIDGDNFTISELTSDNALVGQVTAQDVDGDNLTYSIESGNTNNAFAIDSNGMLRVNDASAIDFETANAYVLEIQVVDSAPLSARALVYVDITNINEVPTISGAPVNSIEQGQSYNFVPSASDPDSGDSLTFSIENKPLWLTFDTQTGQLSGVATNDDVGVTNDIIISVTDANGLSSALAAFSLTVNNVNDAPSISGNLAAVVNEDASFEFVPTAVDIDAQDNLTFVIENKPAWAVFDPTTGRLSGTPTQADIGVTYNVTISVRDNDGASDSLAPVDMVVVNTNDAPSISGTPLTTVAQDALYQFTPSASDEDIGDSLLFAIENKPSWANFDNVTGALTGTPDNSHVGSYSDIVIKVTDAGGLIAALNSFTIVVTNVNDAPVISGAPATTVNQGALYNFTPVATDIDVGDSKRFSISNMPSWASFNTATGQLTGTPANEHVDNYSNIVISVEDSGGLTAALAPFTIAVVNVNDAPVIADAAFSAAEDLAQGSNVGTPLVASDIDEGTAFAFSIVSGNDDAKFAINNNGQLRLVATLDFETTTRYQLDVQVSDGELTDNAIVTITVTDVLDGTDKVINDINEAIESGNTSTLTVDAYESLGITGVTNEIIDLVNQRITTIPAAQLPLTSEQLQVIIDEVSSLYAINKVITTGEGSSTITVTDFENINVVGVTSENLAAVLALLLQQPSELTIEQIQTLVNQVNALKVINDFIASPDDSTRPTITDFDTLNISGVTTENIELILNMLALQTAPLTAEEIQSLIDELLALAKINQYSTSGGISEEPSLSDFADITINSLSDETYQQLLDALVDEPAIRSIADIKALIATLAQGDSDNDGLSNALEAELGSDPNDANSPFADGAGDSDNDGVSNAIEGHLDNLGGATLPQTTLSTDSDGDGLPDVLELAKGFDPLDANDPTTNGDELATNGLSNAVNAYLVELGLAVNGEIDKRNDYDRDGYNDALEIALGSDPQSSNDKDVDLDGVPDVVEAFLTSTINDGTDTKTLDLNSNGLSDAYEVRQAATLSELRQLLEAKEQVDSDGDGISDAVEAFITGDDNDLSVTPTSDADNDGIADVDEILAGSNPLRNDIPVLWIETTMLSDTTLMLDTYFGGLPSSKVSYAWQLTSLTGVGMNVSATDVKQPQVTNLVGGLYLISVTVTRDINGEQLASTATHVVNIDSVGELAVKDSDGDGVADNVDSDNGNTGAEETIPTKIEASDTFKMVTDNGVKLRLGVVAVLSGQNGSEVSEENVQKFGNGQGQAVSADLANDEGFEHIDTFDYEAVNLPQAGASINVFIPLSEPVPEQASLRKFNPTDGWKPYDTSEGDSFATAPAVSEGICSNDIADYSADLTVGDMCLLLVISDGGNNDADGEINGMIQDPVAVSAPEKSDPVTPPTPKPPVEPPEPNYQTGTKGGSMSVILLLLLSAMLLARTRRVI